MGVIERLIKIKELNRRRLDKMTKETHKNIYKGSTRSDSNQARETSIKQGKNVHTNAGSVYSGKKNHDEKSKTR